MIGKSILHYKIIEKLGEGGMGVVYLAEDSKLKRQVAIKFLPGHIAVSSDERKRFEIEAQAAAALNNANIATIHAIEEAENEFFLVMEYISGKHLKDHINSKPLPIEEAVDVARQIAKGLQAAHRKGIVHRDIKSANIMRTDDGHIRIMDFGLAKFRGSAQLTQIGTTVGTAAYMSPEQARGEDADHRADIWSFGVVFYEMLTGHPPFKGEYEQAIIFNLLNEDVTPVSEVNPEIPQEISYVINKCLQKDKEQRYQTMEDILADLKTGSSSQTKVTTHKESPKNIPHSEKISFVKWPFVLAGLIVLLIVSWFLFTQSNDPPGTSKKMLVVLPFENMGNADQEYFAEGITGEITSRLSGLSGLGVIARTSASQYKNTDKTLKQIAAELGIDYVLVGTVQWQLLAENKKRVRVNSELIQVKNSTQIWSKPYDADFADAFQLQSDIAAQVASALDIKLLQNEKKVLDEKLTGNAEAYDFYLQASNYYERSYEKSDWLIAEKLLRHAVTLDPGFAAAYARLSNIQVDKHWFYYDRTPENLNQAKLNIEKAKQLNPDHYIVTEATGWYHYHGNLDYEPALKEFYISLRSQPNNENVYKGIASVLRRQGKTEEALEAFKKSVEVNPRSAVNMGQVAETLFLLRRYDEAEKFLDRSLSLSPDLGSSNTWKAWVVLSRDKNTIEARKIIEKNIFLTDGQEETSIYIKYLIDIIEGDFDSALKNCEEFDEIDRQFYYTSSSYMKAKIFNFLNNKNKAKLHFNEALIAINKKIENNPTDPRYQSALGLIFAGLGQKEKAIKAGIYATELMTVEMEAWRGAWRLRDLAEIYTMVGENQKALSLLNRLLSIPMEISVNIIELDPTWNPLKELPEYKQLVKKYSIKN